MIRWPGRKVAVVLLTVGAMTTACLPRPVTDSGREVADLYGLFMIAAAVVFVVVVGLLAWSIVRYRGEPGRDVPMPRPIHGHMALEVTWWALPAALVALLAVLTIAVLGQVDAREEQPELVVEVAGFQWGWEFTYAEAGVVISGTAADPPSIRLPVDRSIAFVIRSADVVHSFNIPDFLIKRDAIPTRQNRFDVTIELEGTYTGQCGEFCGLLHARQLFELVAVSPEEFDAWLAEQASAQEAAR